MKNLIDLLREEADAADEKSIKLRDAIEALGLIDPFKALGAPMGQKPHKRRGRPARTFHSAGTSGIMIKDIPVKASRGKGKKRKYTKRSAFWKKKK